MIYLASPYSHSNPSIVQERYEDALFCTGALMSRGLHVFSPIVHCHEAAKLHKMPGHFDFWQRYNLSFLRKADQLWIIKLDGWEDSKGVAYELQFAKKLYISYSFCDRNGFEVL